MDDPLTLLSFTASRMDFSSGPSYRITASLGRNEDRLVLSLIRGRMKLRAHNWRLKTASYAMVRREIEPRLGALVYLAEALGRDLAASDMSLREFSFWPRDERYGGDISALMLDNDGRKLYALLDSDRDFSLGWIGALPAPTRADYRTERGFVTAHVRWRRTFGQAALASFGSLEGPLRATLMQFCRILPAKIETAS